MSRIKAAITLSFLLIAVLLGLVLSRAPARIVSKRSAGNITIASTVGDAADCQTDEILPAQVSAIRLGLEAAVGPPLRLQVYSGSRVIAEGHKDGGWTGSSVTVPVKPLAHAHAGVKLCFEIIANSEPVVVLGVITRETVGLVWRSGHRLFGRARIEYLQPGPKPWWSLLLTVARHMGLGHAVSGSWIALLVALLTGSMALLASRILLRELR